MKTLEINQWVVGTLSVLARNGAASAARRAKLISSIEDQRRAARRLALNTSSCKLQVLLHTYLGGNESQRVFGCHVLASSILVYPSDISRWEPLLLRVGEDASWKVREIGSDCYGAFLQANFRYAFKVFRSWSRNQSANVRRAIVVGVMKAGKQRRKEWISGSLRILGRFMADSDRYVRDSLGPFALGDGFIRYAPEETLQFLLSHRNSDNPVVRWNILSAMATDSGVRRIPKAVGILTGLLNDDTPQLCAVTRKMVRHIYALRPRERHIVLGALIKTGFCMKQLSSIRRTISRGRTT